MIRRGLAGSRNAGLYGLRALAFLGYYARIFLVANAVVAWEILTPRSRLAPAVIVFPLKSRSSWEMVCLAHLITLTPGTLVLEMLTEPNRLVVHGMHAARTERFHAQLGELEDRLLAVLRPVRGRT